MFVKTFKSES